MRTSRNSRLSGDDQNFAKKLGKRDLQFFFDFAATAISYHLITEGVLGQEGTHQFVRDIQIARLLQDKFPNIDAYSSSQGFQSWLTERLSDSTQGHANAISRLQGDGAGEIDFLREMQGSLHSLFRRTSFVCDPSGRVPNNVPGIDFREVSRFTGEVVNEYQVKSLRTADTIGQTLRDFVNNEAYNEQTVLVGPIELIEAAKRRGINNPTMVIGSIEDNASSAEALRSKVLAGDMVTELTAQAAIGRVASGALIGAAVRITVSAFVDFIAYKRGKISKEQLFIKIGKNGAKGAISGGALAGLSLFVPGGLIGWGIACVAGGALIRVLDGTFGDGISAEVLDLTRAVQVNINLIRDGAMYVVDVVEATHQLTERASLVSNELSVEKTAVETRLDQIEDKFFKDARVKYGDSIESKLARLGSLRARRGGLDGRYIQT